MKYRKFFSQSRNAGLAFGAAAIMSLTGCVAYVDEPRGEIDAGPPVFVEQDDYVYYPSYGVYYSNSRHEYAYQERGAWVSRPEPRGVSVDVLLASPSVRMDFHDSPANHHAAIARQYPRNWAPSHAEQGQRGDHGNDRGNDNRNDNRDDKRDGGGGHDSR